MNLESVFQFFLFLLLAFGNSKPIQVSLTTKWKDQGIFEEFSEYILQNYRDHYSNFYINFLTHSNFPESSEFLEYELCVKLASKFLSDLQMKLLLLSVSVHRFTPKLIMISETISELVDNHQCDNYFVAGSKVSCDSPDISNITVDTLSKRLIETLQLQMIPPLEESGSSQIIYHFGDYRQGHLLQKIGVMRELAKTNLLSYVFYPLKKSKLDDTQSKNVTLSAYGVYLNVKKSEYKSEDDQSIVSKSEEFHSRSEYLNYHVINGFNFTRLKERFSDKTEKLEDFEKFKKEEKKELPTLKPWHLTDIGPAILKFMRDSPQHEQLKTFQETVQNLPLTAKKITKIKTTPEYQTQTTRLRSTYVKPEDSSDISELIIVNGRAISLSQIDFYDLLDSVESEMRKNQDVCSLFTDPGVFLELVEKVLKTSKHVDVRLDLRSKAVVWINNIEKDRTFSYWSKNPRDFLSEVWPGSFHPVALNVFNVISVLRSRMPESMAVIRDLSQILSNNIPIRVGFIIQSDPNDPIESLIHKSFILIRRDVSVTAAIQFLFSVQNSEMFNNVESIRNLVKKFGASLPSNQDKTIDKVMNQSREFIHRSGIDSFPFVTLNGKILDVNNGILYSLISSCMELLTEIRKKFHEGKFHDYDSAEETMLSGHHLVKRINQKLRNPYTPRLPNLIQDDLSSDDSSSSINSISNLIKTIPYLEYQDNPTIIMWLLIDMRNVIARKFLCEITRQVPLNLAIGIILNPINFDKPENSWDLLNIILHKMTVTHGKDSKFSLKASDLSHICELSEELPSDDSTYMDSFKKIWNEKYNKLFDGKYSPLDDVNVKVSYFKLHNIHYSSWLRVQPGKFAVVVDGQVYGPFESSEELIMDDIKDFISQKVLLISKYNLDSTLDTLAKTYPKIPKFHMNLIFSQHIAIMRNLHGKTEIDFNSLSQKCPLCLFEFQSKNSSSCQISIDFILDPLSQASQKYSSISRLLHEQLGYDLRILFVIRESYSDSIIKSFYRYVLEPTPKFSSDHQRINERSTFVDLPESAIFTLHMDVHSNWMIEAFDENCDMDNIHLAKSKSGCYAIYRLDSILVEGQAYDVTTNSPPGGLQLTLGSISEPDSIDTLVMANLGYFQFKARPGVFSLNLKSDTSGLMYNLEKVEMIVHDGSEQGNVKSEINQPVVVSSYKGSKMSISVRLKPGEDNKPKNKRRSVSSGGIWDSIVNTIFGSSKSSRKSDIDISSSLKDTAGSEDVINIFSVASGMLYERFLRIMMLSVLNHTQSKVKFWFLKNYLSSQMINSLPILSKKMKFDYELVQYKWPSWLNKQTDKQRIIWGYKILFLDVLFPLSVSKIIFVDADQIVRADLQELVDMDLDDAPYGYTPFCDDKPEMDGFRFWKSGYWKNHLKGYPYHISALYVIDLDRFREISAGDRLRGQYQMLSSDPQSLANLDQDLPNDMIHRVPIKSLPQEWLWCETWCSEESKHRAKTIDMCNDPMTREPKLQRAIRIAPEWVVYDQQIKNWLTQNQPSTENTIRETSNERLHEEL